MAEKPSLDTNRLITFSDLVEKPRGEKFETGNLLKLVEFVQVSEGGIIEPFFVDLDGDYYQACRTKYGFTNKVISHFSYTKYYLSKKKWLISIP